MTQTAPGAEGRSPAHLRVPTLEGLIRGRHSEAGVLAVSKKDRVAISLSGRGRTRTSEADDAPERCRPFAGPACSGTPSEQPI